MKETSNHNRYLSCLNVSHVKAFVIHKNRCFQGSSSSCGPLMLLYIFELNIVTTFGIKNKLYEKEETWKKIFKWNPFSSSQQFTRHAALQTAVTWGVRLHKCAVRVHARFFSQVLISEMPDSATGWASLMLPVSAHLPPSSFVLIHPKPTAAPKHLPLWAETIRWAIENDIVIMGAHSH